MTPLSPVLLPAAILGEAIQVLLRTDRNRLRLASIYAFLAPPIALNQIAFKKDARGRPLGYVTWAFVTPEVLGDIASDASRRLDLPEWNEGAELLIADLVSLDGDVRGLMRLLPQAHHARSLVWWRRSDRSEREKPLRRGRRR